MGWSRRRNRDAQEGRAAEASSPAPAALPASEAPGAATEAAADASSPDLIGLLAGGAPPAATVVRLARDATHEPDRTRVRGFLMRLVDDPAGAPLGCLGLGVMLARGGLLDASLGYFVRGGEDVAQAAAVPEYFEAVLAADAVSGGERIVRHLRENADALALEDRMRLLMVLAKHRMLAPLREELARFLAVPGARELPDPALRAQVAWFERMLANAAEPVPEVPGSVAFGVMDYKVLDRSRTSSNRGDYVQTLAALSHLLRFSGVQFAPTGDLAAYLTGLQARVHEDRRIEGPAVTVVPVPIDRDFSSGRAYPRDTWLVCNGWFMHRSFGGEVDFPFPENVNPIMVSFHVQDPSVLTPVVVDRLREYEPIGCRDWTTVYRLRDHGVRAFFSGCVTTTVGQVLAPAAPAGRDRLADVEGRLRPDAYPGWTRDSYIQVGEHVRDFSLVEGLEDARTMLEDYAPYDKVVTSRLHCYLPARSMGLDVHFRPRERSDVRFEGLADLTPEGFAAIRTGIEDKLEAMLRAILDGRSRDEVYALWRELTVDDVAAADAYCADYPEEIGSSLDVDDAVVRLREARVRLGDVPGADALEIAMAIDQNLERMLPVTLQSVLDGTRRPVRCHILTRGLGEEFRERLHALFPAVQLDFYDFDAVDYGKAVTLLGHTSVSTIDRLLLPELLAELDKVLYLDTDLLVQADVAEIWDLELGDAAVAGRPSRLATWASLVRLVTRASVKLRPQAAWTMRRRLHGVGSLAAATFNAGVLVLNLRLMRDERFSARHVGLVESCALNDQDVLNVYAKGRVVPLPARWNTVPSQDCETDPAIIHWAGPAKPWNATYALFADRYRAVAERVASMTRDLA